MDSPTENISFLYTSLRVSNIFNFNNSNCSGDNKDNEFGFQRTSQYDVFPPWTKQESINRMSPCSLKKIVDGLMSPWQVPFCCKYLRHSTTLEKILIIQDQGMPLFILQYLQIQFQRECQTQRYCTLTATIFQFEQMSPQPYLYSIVRIVIRLGCFSFNLLFMRNWNYSVMLGGSNVIIWQTVLLMGSNQTYPPYCGNFWRMSPAYGWIGSADKVGPICSYVILSNLI